MNIKCYILPTLSSFVFLVAAPALPQNQHESSKFLVERQPHQLTSAGNSTNLPALAPREPKYSASLLAEEQTKQPTSADNPTTLPNSADNQPELLPPSISQLQQSSPEQPQTPTNQNADELFETIFGQPQTRGSVPRVIVPFFINDQE